MPAKKKRKRKWIAGAIKKPGALRSVAKRAGAITKDGNIKLEWLRSRSKKKGKAGKRARLAMTLRKMRKRGR